MTGFDKKFARSLGDEVFRYLAEGGKTLTRVCLNYISGKVTYSFSQKNMFLLQVRVPSLVHRDHRVN